MQITSRLMAIGLAQLGLGGLAQAQWTVTNLHPVGATKSQGLGASGGTQVGFAETATSSSPSLWMGTAASRVDLNPVGTAYSTVFAAGGSGVGAHQAGNFTTGFTAHACVWSGTAASRIDLNPIGALYSTAYAADGQMQGGYASIDGVIRAGVWMGAAPSWVNLRPAGSQSSIVYAVNDPGNGGGGPGQQVGFISIAGGAEHAALWRGTAASIVDLDPGGDVSRAVACTSAGGVNGQQAGFSYVPGAEQYHASLWSGTAASWVDLNPAGSTDSSVNAASGTMQAGRATIGGVSRAGVWNGTAASWVDLSGFLPPEFVSSAGQGISTDAAITYVVGYGYNSITSRDEALLWTRSTCAADFNRSGGAAPLSVQDIFDFLNAWFGSDPRADFNGHGLSVQDIFDFLNAWFGGC